MPDLTHSVHYPSLGGAAAEVRRLLIFGRLTIRHSTHALPRRREVRTVLQKAERGEDRPTTVAACGVGSRKEFALIRRLGLSVPEPVFVDSQATNLRFEGLSGNAEFCGCPSGPANPATGFC